MTSAHIIRLRGPWQYQTLSQATLPSEGITRPRSEEPPASGRFSIPGNWHQSPYKDLHGRVGFSRRFNRPTGLTPQVTVCLVFEKADAWAEVILNEIPLAQNISKAGNYRFNISNHLQDHNQLTIHVELPGNKHSAVETDCDPASLPGGLIWQVRLEIEKIHGNNL